jgi:hypothetical protein
MQFFLRNCLVSWQLPGNMWWLYLHEAEYVIATVAATQGLWQAQILGELHEGQAEASYKMWICLGVEQEPCLP